MSSLPGISLLILVLASPVAIMLTLVQLGGNMYAVLKAVSRRKTRLSPTPNWRGICGTQY
jgi:hypothetical protein